MFVDLSWSHMLLVLVVALVVVGPKDLPKLMRTVGRWAGKARAMADQFRKSFDEMARQSDLDELRAEIDALRTGRPLADIEHAMSEPILPHDMMSAPSVPIAPIVHEPIAPELPPPELIGDGAKPPPP
jgi:sec-independent protein translocase protein TatB